MATVAERMTLAQKARDELHKTKEMVKIKLIGLNSLFSTGIYKPTLEEIAQFYRKYIVDLAAVALPGVEIHFGKPTDNEPVSEFEQVVRDLTRQF